jgi:hypothetical protein
MPQNVKIQTGFAEKTSENYNSTQHSISLEMDCVINGSTREIEEASQKLFALCRKIVAAQKGVSVDSLLQSEPAQAGTPQNAPAAPLPSSSNSNPTGAPKPASAKQIRFLLDVAKKSGLDEKSIRALPAECHKASFEALSSTEASRLIDSFSPKRKAA